MSFLFPMRPTTPRVLPETPAGFLAQTKFDGWNVVVNEGRVWTRRGNDITSWCRIWPFDLRPRHPVNGELMAAGGERKDIPSIKTGKFRPRLMAFDLMLEEAPLEQRLEILAGLEGGWDVATTMDGAATSWSGLNTLLTALKRQGHEGLVLKRKGSPYHVSDVISVVTMDWLKLKVPVRVARAV